MKFKVYFFEKKKKIKKIGKTNPVGYNYCTVQLHSMYLYVQVHTSIKNIILELAEEPWWA